MNTKATITLTIAATLIALLAHANNMIVNSSAPSYNSSPNVEVQMCLYTDHLDGYKSPYTTYNDAVSASLYNNSSETWVDIDVSTGKQQIYVTKPTMLEYYTVMPDRIVREGRIHGTWSYQVFANTTFPETQSETIYQKLTELNGGERDWDWDRDTYDYQEDRECQVFCVNGYFHGYLKGTLSPYKIANWFTAAPQS